MGVEEQLRWAQPLTYRVRSSWRIVIHHLGDQRIGLVRTAATSIAVLIIWAGLEAWGRGVRVGVLILVWAFTGTIALLAILSLVWLVGLLLQRREICVGRGRMSVGGKVVWQSGAGQAFIALDASGRHWIRVLPAGRKSMFEIRIAPSVDLVKLAEFLRSVHEADDDDKKPGKNVGSAEDLHVLCVSAAALFGMVGSMIASVWLGRGLRPGLDVEGWGFVLVACPAVLLSTWAAAYVVHFLLTQKGA